MAHLTQIAFDHDGARYELGIDFDDAALMEDQLACTLTARVRLPDGERYQIAVGLTVDFAAGVVRIRFPDGAEREIPLSAFDVRIDKNEEEALDPNASADPLYDTVSDYVGPALLDLADQIPLGDPVLCLVKAGLSALIGQTLACREMRGGRVRDIVQCLRAHVKGIFKRTLWRTARCMLFA